MARQLMILEVSQKQAYIFASRKLRDNRLRSAEIAYVTGRAFFQKACPEGYDEGENLVYTGGGHTVLQFGTKERADRFAKAVTLRVLREFPGMELFVHQRAYEENLGPGENLLALSKELESKKSHRRASFRCYDLGVEKPGEPAGRSLPGAEVKPPRGWSLTDDADEIAAGSGFLAVVHLDGNAMGKRVQTIYAECGGDWDKCRELLQRFSAEIDAHFALAYQRMAEDLAEALEKQGSPRWDSRKLPLRKIVGAGDDVCFLAAGDLGLECAASFLKHLGNQVNRADGKPYSACAGVVLIHKKYPFRQAYDLSEELCSNAKRFGAACAENISAVDYHIEFGQMKDSLGKIRAGYTAEDGTRMELRPLAVLGEVPEERRFRYLTALIAQFQKNEYRVARSELKELRNAIAQGERETRYALRAANAEDILYIGSERRQGEKAAYFTDRSDKAAPVRRCLIFDAIELMDHTTLWREEAQ